jgi:hypothetical protein
MQCGDAEETRGGFPMRVAHLVGQALGCLHRGNIRVDKHTADGFLSGKEREWGGWGDENANTVRVSQERRVDGYRQTRRCISQERRVDA